MTCRGRLKLPLGREAEAALAALAPDNEGHVAMRVEDGVLIVEAESETPMGVLRSLDDVLACLRALGH